MTPIQPLASQSPFEMEENVRHAKDSRNLRALAGTVAAVAVAVILGLGILAVAATPVGWAIGMGIAGTLFIAAAVKHVEAHNAKPPISSREVTINGKHYEVQTMYLSKNTSRSGSNLFNDRIAADEFSKTLNTCLSNGCGLEFSVQQALNALQDNYASGEAKIFVCVKPSDQMACQGLVDLGNKAGNIPASQDETPENEPASPTECGSSPSRSAPPSPASSSGASSRASTPPLIQPRAIYNEPRLPLNNHALKTES
jgi:hypothetical protein